MALIITDEKQFHCHPIGIVSTIGIYQSYINPKYPDTMMHHFLVILALAAALAPAESRWITMEAGNEAGEVAR